MASPSELEEAFAALRDMGTLILATDDPEKYEIGCENSRRVHTALVNSRIDHLNIQNLKVALEMMRGERDALARQLEGARREATAYAEEQRRVIRMLAGAVAESVRMRAREEAVLSVAEGYVTEEDRKNAEVF